LERATGNPTGLAAEHGVCLRRARITETPVARQREPQDLHCRLHRSGAGGPPAAQRLMLWLLRCLTTHSVTAVTSEEAAALARPKIRVDAALREQILVAALFNDAPLIHDNKPVHGSDS
jgi:hypothetical protein